MYKELIEKYPKILKDISTLELHSEIEYVGTNIVLKNLGINLILLRIKSNFMVLEIINHKIQIIYFNDNILHLAWNKDKIVYLLRTNYISYEINSIQDLDPDTLFNLSTLISNEFLDSIKLYFNDYKYFIGLHI